MATKSKALTYNDLALRLDRLRAEYRAQGGNGTLGSGSIISQLKGNEGDPKLLDQINAIQAQMDKMEPKLSSDPQSYIDAPGKIQDAENEVRSLLDGGAKQTDPRVADLLQTIKEQTALVNEQSDYNNKLSTLRSTASGYVKSQNQQLQVKQQGEKESAAYQEQIQKLQNEKVIAQAKGQDTSALDKQISDLNNKNNLAQVEWATGTKETVTAGKVTGATGSTGSKPTGSTGSEGATGATGSGAAGPALGAGQSTTGGTYKTVKGVMQYQDNPFTGEYQGKYYANGKIETPAQIKKDFMDNYGAQAKFIASVPELSNLLSTAIGQNWSSTKWQAEFANTQWAQQHPGDIGAAEIKRVSAPEQYNTDYNAAYTKAVTLANQLGVKLTPQQLGQQVSDIKQAPGSVDQNAVNSGQDVTTWILQHPNASDQQITQFMAQHGTLDPQAKGGTIAAQSTQLAQLAQQYGVYGQYSPDGKDTSFFDKYALNMAQGAVGYDPNTAEQQFKTAAMNTYKPFADQIAGGAKVSDLASPYVNTLSSLLEVNPADIQLGATTGYGAMIGKALMGDGTAPVDPYTFASQVRSQPEWLNTQNAHSTLLSAGNQLIAKMGF